MMASGVLVLIGMDFILEKHDLRPHAVPFLVIAMGQLFALFYRYVFTPNAKSGYLIYDIRFFVAMIPVSGLQIAHVGILSPLQRLISKLFDQNNPDPHPGS